jgi:hypothetical protein
LCWYSRHCEHVGAAENFKVESPITEAAMKAQSAHFKCIKGTGNPGQDPHQYGLKDNLATCDKLKIVCHIYGMHTITGHKRDLLSLGETKLQYLGLPIKILCMPTFECQVVMVPKRRVAFHKPYTAGSL